MPARALPLLAAAMLGGVAPSEARQAVVADQVAYVAPALVDGALSLGVHHGTYADNGETWSPAEQVVVHVPPAARTTLPSHASWAFIGPAGSDVWTTAKTVALAQPASSLAFGVTWQRLFGSVLNTAGARPTLSLRGVRGPGRAYAFSTIPAGTQVGTTFFNLDAGVTTFSSAVTNQRVTIFTWSFTAEGYYCLDLEATARPISGGIVSARAPLAVAVGAVDPAAAPTCTVDYRETRVALDASPDVHQRAGGEVTLTATTTPSDAAGNVQFYDGSTPLGAPVPVAAGSATLRTSALPTGTHRLSATFVPDDSHAYAQSASPPLSYGIHAEDVFVFARDTHADVATRIANGRFELGLRKSDAAGGGNVSWHALDDSVIALPDAARVTIPDDPRHAYIAEPGTTVWRIPLTQNHDLVWLGHGGEALDRELVSRPVSWTLDGVAAPGGGPAPGHVIIHGGATAAKPAFSTRRGLPDGTLFASAHAHVNWDFTAPGAYCLGMTARTRLVDGTAVKARETLTVVVGDTDAYATAPCGRGGPAPSATHPAAPADASGDHAARVHTGFGHLAARLRDGALQVHLLDGDKAGAGTLRDLDDVVFPATDTAPVGDGRAPWAGEEGATVWELRESGDRLGLSTLAIAEDALAGDLTVRLAGVDGPGDVAVHDSRYDRGPLLSSRGVDRFRLLPERMERATWVFTAPGVYCVTLEWTADGAIAATETLTFVAGTRDPATVTPCGHGGTGDDPVDPGGGTGGGGGPASGRKVIAAGHVDLFAAIANGALRLSVKEGDVHHALDAITLHAAPGSRTTIPGAAEYAFLGSAGAGVWLLPQVADEYLLWPGWSMSSDGSVAASGVRWTLDRVRGPGGFVLYANGEFGMPEVLMDSRDGLPDALVFDAHAHANWVFEREGVYCLDVTMHAAGREAVRDAGTLLIAVGDVDAAAATEADCEPRTQPSSPSLPAPEVAPTPALTANRATVAARRGRLRVGRGRTVRVATLACPRAAACTIRAPRRARLTIRGRRHHAIVLVPTSVAPGRTAAVRVRLSPAAHRRLAGRRTTLRLKLRVTTTGTTTTHTVRVVLTVR